MINDIPLLLLIPPILIVLLVIIFIIIIIRDKLAMKNLAIPPLNNIGKEGTKEEKEKKLEEKEAKVEEKKEEEQKPKEKEKEKPEEGTDYYSKIIDLEERLNQMDTKTAYEELIKIVRKFFSDYLNLNYEFTYEELKKELKEKQKKILISSNALSKIEYSPHLIPRNELIKMIEEFKNILVKSRSQPEESRYSVKDINKIKEFIIKGKEISKKDLNKATDIYEKIYYFYYKLPKEEKIKLHKPILEFYKSIR